MRIERVEAILPPETLIIFGDVKGRTEHTTADRFFEIGGIGLGPLQQTAIGDGRVETILCSI